MFLKMWLVRIIKNGCKCKNLILGVIRMVLLIQVFLKSYCLGT